MKRCPAVHGKAEIVADAEEDVGGICQRNIARVGCSSTANERRAVAQKDFTNGVESGTSFTLANGLPIARGELQERQFRLQGYLKTEAAASGHPGRLAAERGLSG